MTVILHINNFVKAKEKKSSLQISRRKHIGPPYQLTGIFSQMPLPYLHLINLWYLTTFIHQFFYWYMYLCKSVEKKWFLSIVVYSVILICYIYDYVMPIPNDFLNDSLKKVKMDSIQIRCFSLIRVKRHEFQKFTLGHE